MADIAVKVKLEITTAPQAFGVKRTDPYGETYQMGALAAQPTAALSNVLVIPEINIAILQPAPVLADLSLSQFTFPLGETWTKNRDASNNKLGILQPSTSNGLAFEADTVAVYPGGFGFICRIGRGQTNGDNATGADYYTILTWGDDTLPDDAEPGAVPVRLLLPDGQPPFAQYATASGNTWVWGAYGENGIGSTSITDSSALWSNSGRAVNILVLVFQPQNAIVIDIDGGSDRLILQAPNQTANVSGGEVSYTQGPGITTPDGRIKVTGKNGSCSLQVFTLGFAAAGSITSGSIQLPFVYQGNGKVSSPGIILPDTTAVAYAVNVISDSGTYINYSLALSAPAVYGALSDRTPGVSQLTLTIPPTGDYTPGAGAVSILTETDMSEVQIHRWLEYHQTPDNSFSVYPRCQVGINFNNTLGEFLGGTFGRHWAVRLSTALQLFNVDTGQYEQVTPWYAQTTGWIGMSTNVWQADPERKFDGVIEDRTWPLRTTPCGAMPYFDGWCWHSAIAFLALAGGILPDFIDPAFFSCDFGPNPPNCPHFKLPVGTGLNPRVYFQADRPYWDAIMEIAGMVHGVIGFTEGDDTTPATLTAMPYYPGVTMTPNRGTITVYDYDYGEPGWLMTFLGSLKVGIDTADRRTGVALFGIDPATNLIQGSFANLADLPGYDPDTGIPYSQFTDLVQGFPYPAVNISSYNVDPAYTALFSIFAMLKLRMPTLKADWTTYYHPASYILDQYTLVNDVALPDGLYSSAGNPLPGGPTTFSVESKLDRFNVLNTGGLVPTSTFSGRRVMNL
jgi:hypothetical protein